MLTAYLCHPLNASTPEGINANRANAAAWGAWFLRTFDVAVSADYLWLSTQWDESEENRALGLRADKAHIERCDFVVLVGGRISTGMAIESAHAVAIGRPVLDLTRYGYDPPYPSSDYEAEIIRVVRAWLEVMVPAQPFGDGGGGSIR